MTAAAHRNKAMIADAVRNFSPTTLEEYLQLYAEDSVLHFLPPELPGGRSGARLFYQAFFAAFPDARLVVDDEIAEGDKVAVRFSIEATHRGEFLGIPATGKPINFGGIAIFRFEEGVCVERWSESGLALALRQLAT